MQIERPATYEIPLTGPWAGKPSTILQLNTTGTETTVQEIIDGILEVSRSELLIIAGNDDPLLQQQELLLLIRNLQAQRRHQVLLQCTGGITPDVLLRQAIAAWHVSIPDEEPAQWNPDALQFYRPAATFGWVVSNQGDIDTAGATSHALHIPSAKILLQPIITDPDENSIIEYVNRACLSIGCSMGHVIIAYHRGRIYAHQEEVNDDPRE